MASTSMSDFNIEKVLGKGSFGSVYLVTRKADQKIYAIKTVILEKLNKKEQENSVNEVRILASVNHPNVIGYKEAFWNDKESSLNIVMEYADDGDLQTKIQKMKKEGGIFTENLIWSYSIQMIEGLKALHDKKIMHRDLKSANIFLVKDNHQCKLGDMNVSKVIKDKVLLTQTGTPYYASPEVWNDKPYSYKSDLWSIGCVIYELCALHPPFHGKDLDELYANVCKGKVKRINPIYSDDLWKMIKMLLQVDVNKRVDCDTFLKSKLIMRKKKELKENNKEFNYIENKLGENINNEILLSTIKFQNINEIKSQLPKNKNYNDENIDYTNINNNINSNVNNKNNYNYIQNYPKLDNINNNYINQINCNYNINNNIQLIKYNQLNKNISEIISNYINKNNNFINNQNNRNNRIINNGKNTQKTNNQINRTNISELNEYSHSYKEYILNRQNNLNKYYSENEKNKKESNQKIIHSELPENKIKQIKPKKEIALNKYASSEHIRKINIYKSKERFKTDLQKEKEREKDNDIKKQIQYCKINPIQSIPISIKRTSTCRQNVSKLNNDIDNFKDKEKLIYNKRNLKNKNSKNYSYLKIEESKAMNKYKYKYNNPFNSNSITEIRSKTPMTFDKNANRNNRINSDIYNNYNYYINHYNRNKHNENSEHQKSVGYLRNNIKTSIFTDKDNNDIYKYFINSKVHKCSKSISDINANINKKKIKEELIKKQIISNKKDINNRQRPISALLSKRIKDFNNLNNNRSIITSLNHNNIMRDNFDKKLNMVRNSHLYYYLDINNNSNSKFNYNFNNSKSNNNRSTMNINYDYDKFILKDNYSPIKHINSCNNNKFYKFNNKNCYEKIPTTIDGNNYNINHKNCRNINHRKLVINNSESLRNRKIVNINEKNIRKINKVRNYTNKRIYDDKSIKQKIKREIITNRDLTEPELLMIFNPIKCKENIRNNNNKKKNLNISLNDNIGQNNFLKHIRHSKNGISNTNNIRINNQYYSNNINNSINNIRNYERNRGQQLFNNYYSINNNGKSKVPVKVKINDFI